MNTNAQVACISFTCASDGFSSDGIAGRNIDLVRYVRSATCRVSSRSPVL